MSLLCLRRGMYSFSGNFPYTLRYWNIWSPFGSIYLGGLASMDEVCLTGRGKLKLKVLYCFQFNFSVSCLYGDVCFQFSEEECEKSNATLAQN